MPDYRLKQDGLIVASASGPKGAAEPEIFRYAWQYARGGRDAVVEQKTSGGWRKVAWWGQADKPDPEAEGLDAAQLAELYKKRAGVGGKKPEPKKSDD